MGKLFLVEWDVGHAGARFLILDAADRDDLFECIDCTGNPYEVRWRRWKHGISLAFDVSSAEGKNDADDYKPNTIYGAWAHQIDHSEHFGYMALKIAEAVKSRRGWHRFTKAGCTVDQPSVPPFNPLPDQAYADV